MATTLRDRSGGGGAGGSGYRKQQQQPTAQGGKTYYQRHPHDYASSSGAEESDSAPNSRSSNKPPSANVSPFLRPQSTSSSSSSSSSSSTNTPPPLGSPHLAPPPPLKRVNSAPGALDFLPQSVKYAMKKLKSKAPDVMPQFATTHLNNIVTNVNNMGSLPDLMNCGEIFSEVAFKDALLNFIPYVVAAYIVIYGLRNFPFITSILIFLGWLFGLHTLIDKKMLSKDKVIMEETIECLDQLEASLQKSIQDGLISVEGLHRARSLLQSRCDQLTMRIQSSAITIRTYDQHFRLRDAVLTSPRVQQVATACGKSQRDIERIFDGLAARQSRRLLRLAYATFTRCVRQVFPLGIHICEKQVEEIRKVAQLGKPLLLLPTHKSHMDYAIVHFVCMIEGLTVPHVVAGDNLNMLIAGQLLRMCGAMFIRRSFRGDELYTAVFNEYITQLLVHGRTIECFIEGGRARSGKVLSPKVGFLKAVVSAVKEGRVDDALIIPIALSYDRVVESEAHIAELQGGKKKKEKLVTSLRNMISLVQTSYRRWLNFGRVDVSFGTPISIRQRITEHTQIPLRLTLTMDQDRIRCGKQVGGAPNSPNSPQNNNSNNANNNNKPDSVVKRMAISLGYSALSECNRIAVILPTALVGTALYLHHDRGMRMSDLVKQVEWLQQQVSLRGGRLIETTNVQESVTVVLDQIIGGKGVKSNLVKRHKDILMTGFFTPPERMELSTFRNQLIHLFVMEGILALAAYHGWNNFRKRNAAYRSLGYEMKHWMDFVTNGPSPTTSPIAETIAAAAAAITNQNLPPPREFNSDLQQPQPVVTLAVPNGPSSSSSATFSPPRAAMMTDGGNEVAVGAPRSPGGGGPEADTASSEGVVIVPIAVNDLLEDCTFLSWLLKLEFVYPRTKEDLAGKDLKRTFLEAMDKALDNGFMTVGDDEEHIKLQLPIDGDGVDTSGRNLFVFLCDMFHPFIDSYYVMLLTFWNLLPDKVAELSRTIDGAQVLGEKLYFDAQIDTYESVAKETLQNAVAVYADMRIIRLEEVPGSHQWMVRLMPQYQTEAALLTVITHVNSFRKVPARNVRQALKFLESE